MIRIYNTGFEKVQAALNVSTLIKTNRTLKILLENLILSSDIAAEIDHHDHNIIDLNDYYIDELSQTNEKFNNALRHKVYNKISQSERIKQ